MLSKKYILSILSTIGTMAVYADPMVNNITGLYSGIPEANPLLCVKDAFGQFQPWQFGQPLNPTALSGNPDYFGAALRLGGCSNSDIYLGWLDVYPGMIDYKPDLNSYVQLTDYDVSSTSIFGQISLLPIPSTNDNFPINTRDANDWYTGVNLSGLEFSTLPNATVIPDISDNGKDAAATATFLSAGANMVRLPVRWEYMQPYGESSVIDDQVFSQYFNNLVVPTLSILTAHKYYVALDLHAYMHYSPVGRYPAGCALNLIQCPAGQLITDPLPYVNIWTKMFTRMQDLHIDTSHIMIDIVNEPTVRADEGQLTAQQAFDMQVAVIKSLNKLGFNGKYLVEGVGWSGLHSWAQAGNAQVFTRANFLAAGLDEATIDNQIVINPHQYLDSDYSGTHNQCLTDLTTTGIDGFNLDEFVAYLKDNKFKAIVTEFGVGTDQGTCGVALNSLLQYFQQNRYSKEHGYGFIGWTAWSTGHGWGDYNLLITPTDWKSEILKKYFN